MKKLSICLDFDGVVHSFKSGWQGTGIIPDPPVDGAKEAIDRLREKYEIIIFTPRYQQDKGRAAVIKWLRKHKIVVDDVCGYKPPAHIYVDDRATQFKGWVDCMAEIRLFTHWQEE